MFYFVDFKGKKYDVNFLVLICVFNIFSSLDMFILKIYGKKLKNS